MNESSGSEGGIARISAPKGQFAAVEAVSVEGVPNDYPEMPGFSAMSTVLVDLGTLDASRSVNGVSRDWCA